MINAARAAVARRGFHSSIRRLSHFPEGPYSNLPVNPHGRWFFLQFWGFFGTGFFLPFGIATWQTYKPK